MAVIQAKKAPNNQQTLYLRKQYNRSVILNTVRCYSAVSRTRLREVTGIRLASITELVKDLTGEGFLVEAGTVGEDRGRKQTLLRLNPEGRFAIGVEFDADHIVGVIVNLEAQVVGEVRHQLSAEPDRDTILQGIFQTVDEAMKNPLCRGGKFLGIGLADPGLVDSRRGVSVFSTTIRDWRDVPLKQIVEDRFALPVVMEENTRSKALCEIRFGAGKDIDNLMYIDFGMGIGCGFVCQGQLYRGFSESAGELGHMRVMEGGPVCNCGSYGCLESVASLPAIAHRAVRAIREGAVSLIAELAGQQLDTISADHGFEAARRGDKLALGIMDDTARYLGIAIANAVNLLNPQMIVFDSRMGRIADLILEPIQRTVMRQALGNSTRGLRFEISRMSEDIGAVGAATIVLDKVFEIPQLKIPEFI